MGNIFRKHFTVDTQTRRQSKIKGNNKATGQQGNRAEGLWDIILGQ